MCLSHRALFTLTLRRFIDGSPISPLRFTPPHTHSGGFKHHTDRGFMNLNFGTTTASTKVGLLLCTQTKARVSETSTSLIHAPPPPSLSLSLSLYHSRFRHRRRLQRSRLLPRSARPPKWHGTLRTGGRKCFSATASPPHQLALCMRSLTRRRTRLATDFAACTVWSVLRRATIRATRAKSPRSVHLSATRYLPRRHQIMYARVRNLRRPPDRNHGGIWAHSMNRAIKRAHMFLV